MVTPHVDKIMSKFPTTECPLCGKILKLRQAPGKGGVRVNLYACLNDHYEVEFDNSVSIQRMIVAPYSIDTHNDSKSRIYRKSGGTWKFVLETSRIKPDTEQALRERIATLLP